MKQRICVGALLVHNDKILMVNHKRENRYDFWVAPGGGVKDTETMQEAVIRETFEETGFEVSVGKLLYIEELFEPSLRLIKFWFLCDLVQGELNFRSVEAQREYIVDAKYMSKQELRDLIVFPPQLKHAFWEKYTRCDFAVEHLPLREMEFY